MEDMKEVKRRIRFRVLVVVFSPIFGTALMTQDIVLAILGIGFIGVGVYASYDLADWGWAWFKECRLLMSKRVVEGESEKNDR